MIELHTLKPAKGAREKSFRIGRGNASGRGTTSGKGTKGQRARSGGRNKLKLKGIRAMMLSFPKNRGFKSQHIKPETVSIGRLAAAFTTPANIDLKAMKKAELISRGAQGARIVCGGEITIALKLTGILASLKAKEQIEKVGGKLA